MANRKIMLPQYGTVMKRGVLYYRTRIKDANGKLVALYAKTPEELYNKETLALEQIENATFHRKTPTVAEYCEKWLLMQSVHVRATTLTDYTSKVRRHIIAELGDKRMGEVSLDDIQLALVPVSKKSASVYKSVVILYKSIFRAAMESRIIDHNPTVYLTTKGGGVPKEDRQALTDEQAERLLDAIRDLPPYVFVMIGLYAGLRREEILALQWDSVYLDTDTPYLTVRRAWHTEHNRPVISDELKTKAAERNIPLPVCLAECLKAAKEASTSEYVVSNRDGDPLSYTQFKRLWQYIVTRTVKERSYYRYEDGKRVRHTVTPVLGEKAAHNGKVVYSLDFEVERLLDAIRDLPPYVFVMIGLYAGLRREEILALQWDSVYLDTDTPYLTVRRAWHTEHNRPVISDELKTKAAERNIPLPVCLAECLKAAKEASTSEYVVSNRDGDPLSYTQFKRLWQYIVTRTVKERSYYRYEDGKRVKHTVTPVLGEKAAHNGKVVYSLDFEVTPHQLRHTYITNLIHASVDPKTVQYLAGHESSKITMDIYAKVKYNRPDELVRSMNCAFASWDAVQ